MVIYKTENVRFRRKPNFRTSYSIYIYIYSSYFRIFLENSAILPKEAGIMTENKVFTCVFLQNASNTRRISGNSCVLMYVCCETRYFRLFLQKSPCSATITGNLCVISRRNRPRIPATDAKTSPLPVIYPPATRLCFWACRMADNFDFS